MISYREKMISCKGCSGKNVIAFSLRYPFMFGKVKVL